MVVNVIVFLVIALIIVAAGTKLAIDRKKGGACSSCPHARFGSRGFDCPKQ